MQQLKLLLVSLGLLIISTYATADRTLERSFDVASGGTLELRTDTGSIEIETHNSNSIEVEVTIDGLEEDEFQVSFEQKGKDLTIEGDKQSSGWGSWGSQRVHFEITVPKTYNLDLNTAGGSIVVDDINGRVEVRTSGGSLSFGKIDGILVGRTSGGSIELESATESAELRTSGGSISVEQAKGNLVAKTSGGSLRLGQLFARAEVATSGGSIVISEIHGPISARTSGGSIKANFIGQPKSDVELATSAGSINVELESDVAINLYARGYKVFSDFPVDGQTEARYKLKGKINGGGPELELQTSAGNVHIIKK